MSKKLYVGNLSFNSTTDGLREAFEKAGPVEDAIVMTDKMTGRSRGFGFVTMATDEGAAAAIEMYNGKDMDGRQVTVNEARPMTERPPRSGCCIRGGGRGGFGGGRGGFGGGSDY